MTLIILVNNYNTYGAEAVGFFYQNPNYINFKNHINDSVNRLVKNNRIQDEDDIKIIVTYIAEALNKNPRLMTELTLEYQSYNETTRKILSRAIGDLKNIDQIVEEFDQNELLPNFDVMKNVEEANFIVKSKQEFNRQDLEYNSSLASCLWAAYDATGEEKYIIKMQNFVRGWPIDLQKLARKMVNLEAAEAIDQSEPNYSSDAGSRNAGSKDKYSITANFNTQNNEFNSNQLKSVHAVLNLLNDIKERYLESLASGK